MGLAASFLILCFCAIAAWPGGSVVARTPDHTARRCGDFLTAMHQKPHGLRYLGCSYLPDRQGKPLRAIYQVSGREAARTERYLVKAIGMPRLRRFCCQWESPRHSFRGADGQSYDLTMVSDESAIGSRAGWDRIPRFEVIVETFTEEI